MNSYERVYRRLEREKVDRMPNFSLVMFLAAKEAGVGFGEFVQDYRLLTEGAFRCHEKYGLDLVCAVSDPMREAEGFGAQVVIPENAVPYSPVPRIRDVEDISGLKVCDPSKGRRMNDRLEAVRLMRQRAGGDVPVVGWGEGALAESCDLMGMQECMMALIDEPEAMEELLNICLEQALWFAKEQVRAGADMIGVGDAASSLIGYGFYEEFALPYQQKLIQGIHDAGAKVRLHICGNTTSVLELIAESGADIVDLDYMVDQDEAAGILPDSCCIDGNIDPVSVMLGGTPEQVRQEVLRCREFSDRRLNFISAGCEIPADTPYDNLIMMKKTLEEAC